jgi:hypothetical protein
MLLNFNMYEAHSKYNFLATEGMIAFLCSFYSTLNRKGFEYIKIESLDI